MRYIQKPGRAGAGPLLLLATLLALASTYQLRAQDFERTFGRNDDEIGKAVQVTPDGEYITAGYTQNPGTLETRAYVVRLDANGGVIWERRFKLGSATQTFGMDLKRLASGDHILVGSVGTPSAGCVGCVNVYAIRFTDAGDLVWFRTYGNGQTNKYATSVVETQITMSSANDVDNLVIAGYTDDLSSTHGFLMRLWPNGEVRWVNDYDPNLGGTPDDNRLMSVDEVRTGAGAGDIVATGYANDPSTRNDVWVLRVDGSAGTIIAGSQGSAMFATNDDDRGYSIQELRLGANPGDLVIAGESFGRPGTSNSEILMLQTRPDPCDPSGQRADQFIGDNGALENYARCVREISDPQLGTVGDVVVTGASRTTTFSLSLDLFLQQYSEGTMAPATPHHVYGGRRADQGNAVEEVTRNPGFIAAGSTASSPPSPAGHRDDLYIVRTNAAMRSCTEKAMEMSEHDAGLAMTCNPLTINRLQWQVLCAADSGPLGWEFDLCN